MDPRAVVQASNMPAYPWLAEEKLDADDIVARMRALRLLGDPYTDEDIAGTPAALEGRTALDALVAYLQGLGLSPDGEATP